MGKRSAAITDSHQNGCNGGVSNKRMKYNNGQDHHNHQQQQQQNLHYNSPLGSLGYHLIKDNTELTPNITSLLLTTSNIDKESPKPEFQLSRELVNDTILTDLIQKQWRIGNPIGKGSFGEIFLASDNISIPVTNENAKYVAKIEPHSNGPLFVEIHCLLNTAKPSVDNPLPPGMPAYIASGSHYFRNTRYRFLILQRFDRDLHSIIKNRKVDQKSVLILAVQILEVLEHLHDKGYCHSDIKAENLMISKCTYHKNHMLSSSSTLSNKSNNINGGNNCKIITKKVIYNNSSINNNYNNKNNKINLNYNNQIYKNNNVNGNSNSNNNMKSTTSSKKHEHDKNNYRKDEEDSNDDDDDDDDKDVDDDYDIPKHFRKSTSNNNCTGTGAGPSAGSSSNKKRIYVPYSGSNPVRSCRITNKQNSSTTYQEMVSTHYLRPTKKINYSQFFGDDTSKSSGDDDFTLDEYITHHKQRLNKKHNDSDLNDFLYNSNSNSSSCSNNDSNDSTSNNHYSSKGTNNNSNNHNGNISGKNNHKKQNNQQKRRRQQQQHQQLQEENQQKFKNNDWITEDRIFLIDFGLASKFMDSNGVHRPFCMDQRRAHDGTLEFTSRDAHMGAHARRSDLECLGYNLIFWSQGYLPWKENAIQQQRENVHGMKEYLMTDVKEMLKQIYGKTVPKYLGEYMHYVGKLSYQERPNYDKCKRIFQAEYLRLITSTTNSTTSTSTSSSLSKLNLNNLKMTLNVSELIKNSIDIKEECENNNLFEMKNSVKMIMKNLGVTPFRENGFFTTLNTSTNHSSNRVSPKNLRSKSDRLSSINKKGKNSKSKKFSWADILSKDPDQIARERAEKEFEREETIIDSTPTRYKGNPTYAILEVQNRTKFKDRLQEISSTSFNDTTLKDTNDESIRELQMKGFTRPMIDVVMKKRKSSLFNNTADNTNLNISTSTSTTTASTAIVSGGGGKNQQRNSITTEEQIRKVSKHLQRSRSKLGLRTVITPTKRGLDYKHSLIQRRNKRDINGFNKNLFVNGSNGNGNSNYTSSTNLMTDEELSSCSSMNSVASSSNLSNSNSRKNSKKTITVSLSVAPSISSSTRSLSIQGDASSNNDMIELSDNDDVDDEEKNDDVESEDEHEEKQNEINENEEKEEKEIEHDYQILKTIIRKTKKPNHNHQNQNHYHNQVSSSSSTSNKKTQKKNKDCTAISVTLNGGKATIEVSSKRKGRKRTKTNDDSKKKRQGKKRKTKSKSPSSSSSKKKKKAAKEKTKRKVSKKQKYSNDSSYHVINEEEENEDENVSFFIKENELTIRETEIEDDNEANEVKEEKDNYGDDGYNDEDAEQEEEEEEDDDDNVSSDYEYYSVQKTNGNNCNNGHHIPVATFRKRLKRTRSG